MMTVRDLEVAAQGSVPDTLHFKLLMWKVAPPPYDEWADLIEQVIVHVAVRMGRKRNHLQELSEDALTTSLTLALEAIGLDADMQVVNGNCDVVVQFRDYLWLGEAKLAKGVSVIWEGYQQLMTRYVTGQPTEKRGGMLIYAYRENVTEFMDQWRAALAEQIVGIRTADWPHMAAAFSSESSTPLGLQIDVVHLPLLLHHEPEDDGAKLSEKAKAVVKQVKRTNKSAARKTAV